MKLKNVSVRYGEVTALSDVNVEFAKGEVTAVLGESGAGKTTLLRVIAGLVPYEGEKEGADRVSYLFQEAKLLPNLTAEGNLRFVLAKEDWDKIGDMLKEVGLEGKEKRYPHELSGGEKQRGAIARARLFPHDMLLLDEPFSSLDLALKRALTELFLSLCKERGETAVFVTHDVHEAALVSRRAVVLKKGKLIADIPVLTPPKDFFTHAEEENLLVQALLNDRSEKS
ncbi:MAG: ABC transporter ATP-binding protein [Clostridiales bacterium]|nr:ABC transporter ATP-binding protein [Clostridiales bacterium]